MAEASTVLCQIRCITLCISKLINRAAGRPDVEKKYPESAMLDEIMENHDLGPADAGHLYKVFHQGFHRD